jgi:hypothetical protein
MAATLIALGDLRAAEPVVHEWQLAEPNNAEMLQYTTLLNRPVGPALIDVSEDTADDGRRLRLDGPATSISVKAGKPRFAAGQRPDEVRSTQR